MVGELNFVKVTSLMSAGGCLWVQNRALSCHVDLKRRYIRVGMFIHFTEKAETYSQLTLKRVAWCGHFDIKMWSQIGITSA